MWEISNNLQIFGLLRAVLLGCIFCFLYDFLRAFRKTVKCSDLAVFWQDIFYFSFCSPVTFLFLLAVTNGEMRAYVFFGIALGFICFRIIFSFFVLKILNFLFGLIKKMYLYLSHFFNMFFC